MKVTTLTLSLVMSLGLEAGCAPMNREPVAAPSTEEAGYAERYPDSVVAARERLARLEQQSRDLTARFGSYPGELKEPSWPHVLGAVTRADQAGRKAGYALRAVEVENVIVFYADEKGELHRQVGGSAQYVVKQKECDVEVYGPVVHRMDKAMEKQLEERLRAHNEAQRYIEENRDALGKTNFEKVQKQADEIAYASYLTHVAIEQTQRDLEALVDEAAEIEKTLERVLEESAESNRDSKRSEDDKAATEKRMEAARQAKVRVKVEAQRAEQALKEADERAAALEKRYEEAFEALKKELEKRIALGGGERT